MYGSPNPLVHAAAAEISAHGGLNLLIARLGSFRQQRRRRHDLSRLAISALRHLLRDPRLLHRMRIVGRQSLDGGDLLRSNSRDGGLARADRLAIKVHRTSAAQPHPTAVLGAGHVELVAQNPQQRSIRSDLDLVWTVVDQQLNWSHRNNSGRRDVGLDEATPETYGGANGSGTKSMLWAANAPPLSNFLRPDRSRPADEDRV